MGIFEKTDGFKNKNWFFCEILKGGTFAVGCVSNVVLFPENVISALIMGFFNKKNQKLWLWQKLERMIKKAFFLKKKVFIFVEAFSTKKGAAKYAAGSRPSWFYLHWDNRHVNNFRTGRLLVPLKWQVVTTFYFFAIRYSFQLRMVPVERSKWLRRFTFMVGNSKDFRFNIQKQFKHSRRVSSWVIWQRSKKTFNPHNRKSGL